MTWHDCILGDFLTLQRGHDLPIQSRQDGCIPVVSSSGITGYHNKAKAKAPGVVTGRYGTLGQVYYIEEDYWALNTALYVIDFKGNHPKFAAYLLEATLRNYQSDKAAVPGVDRKVLHQLKVRVPDIRSQIAITNILACYDDLIQNNRRRISLLEEAARQLYQEWFVRLRFPGYENSKIVDGVPEGWERRPLSVIANVNQSSLNGSFDGEIDYIDISAVSPGRVESTAHYDFRDAPSRARRKVKNGDILWSCVRPNRRSHAVVWNPQESLIASTGFAVLSPTEVPTSFLYQATTTDTFVGRLEKLARGAAYPAVLASDFETAQLLVPDKTVISSFDELVKPTMLLCHVLDRQSQKLRQARDLLLPRLMSGEITV